MVLVHSVIRKLPNSLFHMEESMAHLCKESLLKVREGKYKRKHGGAEVDSVGRESRASHLYVLLKLKLIR
jgi:hypothetical protein